MPPINEMLGEIRPKPPHEVELPFREGVKPTQPQLVAMTESIFAGLQKLTKSPDGEYWRAFDPEIRYHFLGKTFWIYLNSNRISLVTKNERLDLADPANRQVLNIIRTAELEVRPAVTV